ncbi:matrix metalloproteinase-9-like [Hydractinia symbiolongicarpus]|uniref:matrix metalloproteinase-9-like n=1 Tax=Hydractinia symbiolongicarpus TaxID=13093 RepID=UPI00255069E1|nr:matrix metalloproteinase-9-like [Hydractinia symbiolongicarpus]
MSLKKYKRKGTSAAFHLHLESFKEINMKIAVLLLTTLVAVNCDLDVRKYLKQFSYYNPNSFDQSSVSDALKSFQKTFGLIPTGVADEATTKFMKTPRCGRPDFKSNAFADSKWQKTDLTYYFHNYSPDMSQYDQENLMAKAFKFWSDVTPLRFTKTYGSGDIVISFGQNSHYDGRRTCGYPFDGASGVLAHAFFPPDGRLHFDDAEHYTKESTSGTNFLWVATHELGHILGLEHDTTYNDAVMYPYYRAYTPGMSLHNNDIYRIQRQYGSTGTGTGTGGGSTCVDENVDCRDWQSNCNGVSDDWTQYMATYCKKTCNLC